MKKIGICNNKGGVGKTTICFCLAGALGADLLRCGDGSQQDVAEYGLGCWRSSGLLSPQRTHSIA